MFQDITYYMIKVIICSGIFVLYYYAALRNKRFHYYNRFYLLITIALSAVLPLLSLQWFTFNNASPQAIHIFNIIYSEGTGDLNAAGSTFINLQQVLFFCVGIVSLVMLIAFYTSIIKIYRIKRQYPVNKSDDFDFINTDIQQAPFSFLRNIFWRTDISLQDETGKQILQHEITHIKQKHSWDKLFIELMICFYWMNPFYWLLKKELYLVHEFIADEEAVGKNDASAFAKMLLTSRYGKFRFLPAQSIFYSPIKRRLIMLTTSKNPRLNYLRRLMILPLLAVVVCLFAFTVKNENNIVARQKIVAVKPFVLVVDAGHGGKDNGSFGNGLYEKDVTLKIALKIKDLSEEHGIDVVLTRNTDLYMTPSEKSIFANAQNADAFVSIHVNSKSKNESINSGLEVYVSKDNFQQFSSVLLGSAILQSLRPDFQTPQALSARNVGIWVLKNSNPPAALIECGYITNANDAKLLKDDAKIELMAKNILQGVALYANNKNSISPENIINSNDTTPSTPIKANRASGITPLFVLDEKIISAAEMKKIDPNTIESVTVLKDKTATDKYGNKGKDGVVEIVLKNKAHVMVSSTAGKPLYILDGKAIPEEEFKKIDPNTIESVTVLKDKQAADKYSDKGKYGVIEIVLKKTN